MLLQRSHVLAFAALVVLTLPALPAVAQNVVEAGAQGAAAAAAATEYEHATSPRLAAARATGPIAVDGAVDDSAWEAAVPVVDFIQVAPNEGQPGSEATAVRIVYDDDAIYVGVVLSDRSPVTTRLARRDSGLGDSDQFEVMFDSYHDHETAYRFWTNPSGVKGDAIVTANANGGGDDSWDPVWDLATEVTADGWSLEMRIPFSQLRFAPNEVQVWGAQFERSIQRNQEQATFPFTPTVERAGVSRFAHMDGIQGIEPGQRLEILPYVVGRSEHVRAVVPTVGFDNPYRSGSDQFGGIGADLKYRLTSNITLDATVNPDFGQVEADPSVINLTAFETRYEERRPFFVEGADIFRFSEAGPMGSVGTGPQLLYSRRIGRSPTGSAPGSAAYSETPSAVTIAAAAKVTGRLADGWSIGILEAVTLEETADYVDADQAAHEVTVEPTTNYFVGRVRRQIRGGQTRFGTVISAVNRDVEGTPLASQLHTSAYAGGLDFAHESEDRIWLFTSAISATHVRGSADAITRTQRSSLRYYQRPDADYVELDPDATSLSGYYLMGYAGKQGGRFTMRNGVGYVSPGYEANDLGFHTNADRILVDTHYQWTERVPGRFFRQWSAIIGGPDAVWNSNGDRLFGNINFLTNVTFLNYWQANHRVQYNPASDDDRLTRGGPIGRVPDAWQGNFGFNSDSRRMVTFRAAYNWGLDNAGGWSRGVDLGFSARVRETLTLNVSPNYSRSYAAAQYVTRIGDPLAERTYGSRYVFAGIDRTTVSLETRLNFTVSPALSLEVYLEPFISTGDYGPLKEFRAPGTFQFLEYGEDIGTSSLNDDGAYEIDPDGDGPAEGFSVGNRDFSHRSLLGNAVIRWEWRQGSTLYLVWQQRRVNALTAEDALASQAWVGTFELGRDATDMFDFVPDNVFMVKLSYWLNP